MKPADERALLHQGGEAGTWGSLGLWPAADYASACRALAFAVGQAAGLQPACRVLSVACGAGDELLLWQTAFGAAAVVGVERDAGLVARSQAACAGQSPIRVLQGSGTDLLSLGLPRASFDAVLCVDAAYHLRPRGAFLRGAGRLLRPGGRLAFTDLLIEERAPRATWRTTLLRGAASACGLNADELLNPDEQLQRVQAAGFADARLRRLDEAVLGGFARHVQAQAQRHGLTMWQSPWRRPTLTARLIGSCRAAGLGYALIAATRPVALAGSPEEKDETSPAIRSATI